MTISLTAVVNIDAATMSTERAADYLVELSTRLAARALVVAGETDTVTDAVTAQLKRLTDYNPVFAPRVGTVHAQLVAIGYSPHVPKSEKGTPPSYISYIDPRTGANLGNLNSETFMVMRGALRDELVAQGWEANSRYAYLRLHDDDAVAQVLTLARTQLG